MSTVSAGSGDATPLQLPVVPVLALQRPAVHRALLQYEDPACSEVVACGLSSEMVYAIAEAVLLLTRMGDPDGVVDKLMSMITEHAADVVCSDVLGLLGVGALRPHSATILSHVVTTPDPHALIPLIEGGGLQEIARLASTCPEMHPILEQLADRMANSALLIRAASAVGSFGSLVSLLFDEDCERVLWSFVEACVADTAVSSAYRQFVEAGGLAAAARSVLRGKLDASFLHHMATGTRKQQNVSPRDLKVVRGSAVRSVAVALVFPELLEDSVRFTDAIALSLDTSTRKSHHRLLSAPTEPITVSDESAQLRLVRLLDSLLTRCSGALEALSAGGEGSTLVLLLSALPRLCSVAQLSLVGLVERIEESLDQNTLVHLLALIARTEACDSALSQLLVIAGRLIRASQTSGMALSAVLEAVGAWALESSDGERPHWVLSTASELIDGALTSDTVDASLCSSVLPPLSSAVVAVCAVPVSPVTEELASRLFMLFPKLASGAPALVVLELLSLMQRTGSLSDLSESAVAVKLRVISVLGDLVTGSASAASGFHSGNGTVLVASLILGITHEFVSTLDDETYDRLSTLVLAVLRLIGQYLSYRGPESAHFFDSDVGFDCLREPLIALALHTGPKAGVLASALVKIAGGSVDMLTGAFSVTPDLVASPKALMLLCSMSLSALDSGSYELLDHAVRAVSWFCNGEGDMSVTVPPRNLHNRAVIGQSGVARALLKAISHENCPNDLKDAVRGALVHVLSSSAQIADVRVLLRGALGEEGEVMRGLMRDLCNRPGPKAKLTLSPRVGLVTRATASIPFPSPRGWSYGQWLETAGVQAATTLLSVLFDGPARPLLSFSLQPPSTLVIGGLCACDLNREVVQITCPQLFSSRFVHLLVSFTPKTRNEGYINVFVDGELVSAVPARSTHDTVSPLHFILGCPGDKSADQLAVGTGYFLGTALTQSQAEALYRLRPDHTGVFTATSEAAALSTADPHILLCISAANCGAIVLSGIEEARGRQLVLSKSSLATVYGGAPLSARHPNAVHAHQLGRYGGRVHVMLSTEANIADMAGTWSALAAFVIAIRRAVATRCSTDYIVELLDLLLLLPRAGYTAESGLKDGGYDLLRDALTEYDQIPRLVLDVLMSASGLCHGRVRLPNFVFSVLIDPRFLSRLGAVDVEHLLDTFSAAARDPATRRALRDCHVHDVLIDLCVGVADGATLMRSPGIIGSVRSLLRLLCLPPTPESAEEDLCTLIGRLAASSAALTELDSAHAAIFVEDHDLLLRENVLELVSDIIVGLPPRVASDLVVRSSLLPALVTTLPHESTEGTGQPARCLTLRAIVCACGLPRTPALKAVVGPTFEALARAPLQGLSDEEAAMFARLATNEQQLSSLAVVVVLYRAASVQAEAANSTEQVLESIAACSKLLRQVARTPAFGLAAASDSHCLIPPLVSLALQLASAAPLSLVSAIEADETAFGADTLLSVALRTLASAIQCTDDLDLALELMSNPSRISGIAITGGVGSDVVTALSLLLLFFVVDRIEGAPQLATEAPALLRSICLIVTAQETNSSDHFVEELRHRVCQGLLTLLALRINKEIRFGAVKSHFTTKVKITCPAEFGCETTGAVATVVTAKPVTYTTSASVLVAAQLQSARSIDEVRDLVALLSRFPELVHAVFNASVGATAIILSRCATLCAENSEYAKALYEAIVPAFEAVALCKVSRTTAGDVIKTTTPLSLFFYRGAEGIAMETRDKFVISATCDLTSSSCEPFWSSLIEDYRSAQQHRVKIFNFWINSERVARHTVEGVRRTAFDRAEAVAAGSLMRYRRSSHHHERAWSQARDAALPWDPVSYCEPVPPILRGADCAHWAIPNGVSRSLSGDIVWAVDPREGPTRQKLRICPFIGPSETSQLNEHAVRQAGHAPGDAEPTPVLAERDGVVLAGLEDEFDLYDEESSEKRSPSLHPDGVAVVRSIIAGISSSSESEQRAALDVSFSASCVAVTLTCPTLVKLVLTSNDIFVLSDPTSALNIVETGVLATIMRARTEDVPNILPPILSPVTNIVEVHTRFHAALDIGVEIFFSDGASTLLVFEERSEREELLECFRTLQRSGHCGRLRYVYDPSVFADRLAAAQRAWVSGQISNFEYLMELNTLGGRSFNDPSQYPVMPFVLKDYDSSRVDVVSQNSFRDLSKPMGALGEDRLRRYKIQYEEMKSMSPLDLAHVGGAPYIYGHCYSHSATPAYFFLRMEPYAAHHRALQSGAYDHPNRMFSGIQRLWASASGGNKQEVAELTPEFFTSPEFLEDLNSFGFPTGDGASLSTVVLPPWAHGSATEFVRTMMCALESPVVTSRLPLWIALMFGNKQRGRAAETSDNLFTRFCYSSHKDVLSLTGHEREAAMHAILFFGHVPSLLFHRNHPQSRRSSVLPALFSNPSSLQAATSHMIKGVVSSIACMDPVPLAGPGYAVASELGLLHALRQGTVSLPGRGDFRLVYGNLSTLFHVVNGNGSLVAVIDPVSFGIWGCVRCACAFESGNLTWTLVLGVDSAIITCTLTLLSARPPLQLERTPTYVRSLFGRLARHETSSSTLTHVLATPNATLSCPTVLCLLPSPISALAAAPEWNLCVAGTVTGDVIAADLAHPQPLFRATDGRKEGEGATDAIAISPYDGTIAASTRVSPVSNQSTLRTWSINGRGIASRRVGARINALCFAKRASEQPNASLLLAACKEIAGGGATRVFSATSGDGPIGILPVPEAPATAVAVAGDGAKVFVGDARGYVTCFE